MNWESYLYKYLGGAVNAVDNSYWSLNGSILEDSVAGVKVLRCPVDRWPKDSLPVPGGWVGDVSSYCMNSAGPSGGTQLGFPSPLPPPNYGIGVYWGNPLKPYVTSFTGWSYVGGGAPWDPEVTFPYNAAGRRSTLGYRGSVVADPSGTIVIVEQPNWQGSPGNEWPSTCLGPYGPQAVQPGWIDLCQMPAPTIARAGSSWPDANWDRNQGAFTYKAHGGLFNYLFHDGHMQALKVEQTIGTGGMGMANIPQPGGGTYPSTRPLGMWTLTPGD